MESMVLLQCFCGLKIFVLTSWGNADTDIYVPVIENLEAAMITARNAMLDKGWSPDPKCYDERRFAARRRPPAGTKCHAHSAKEEEGVSESETEGTTPDGEDEPLPRQKYNIANVNQAIKLSKRVWTDSAKKNHWTWAQATSNPALATAIMKWQLKHHLQLEHCGEQTEARDPLLTQQLKLLWEKLSVQEGTELKPGGHSKRKHSGLPEDQHEKKRKPDQGRLVHKMCLDTHLTTCTKCGLDLLHGVQCITCMSHHKLYSEQLCLGCFQETATTSAEHAGHIWRIVYLPSDFEVVQAALLNWIPHHLHCSVPTAEQQQQELERELEFLDAMLVSSSETPIKRETPSTNLETAHNTSVASTVPPSDLPGTPEESIPATSEGVSPVLFPPHI
ncbi:uncharacterized protein ACA1_249280 [Acanthamoeba castellanii str. Neff]|uniref:ZZ-type domain-containing protein n=1 Tax=Acanthamoeba castellanii (strain ATCC 30010 / Neff) TaxID=1257118 RepID=L8H0G7_ACACF|nr:uncharacterized protein ACA1_249280 [Acanthamoeba castellanii str. Neff]ELR17871.1 hypothetical protein ACA1_249280 [Acanthamoeba castellanii str. Neff]